MKTWKIKLTEEAHEDFKNLDGSQRKVVLKQLVKLERNPSYGKPLGKKLGIDLTGFYKLYADRKRIRIIYTVEEAEVKVVAIDRREDMEVYRIAVKRVKELGKKN